MTYDYKERSSNLSEPVALYQFQIGSRNWYYADGEEDFETVIGGEAVEFIALPISDEGMSQAGDPGNEDVTIRMASNTPIADLYKSIAPSQPLYVFIRNAQRGEDYAPIVWYGTVKAVKPISQVEIELTCRTEIASMDRQGLRLTYQRGCPHALYNLGCNVSKAAWGVTLTVNAVSGNAIIAESATSFGIGRLAGGFLEFVLIPGVIERRAIETHGGVTIGLLEGADGIEPGMQVTVYPGCPRTIEGCQSFNNLPNYGGFNQMPGKSPFDGSPVF